MRLGGASISSELSIIWEPNGSLRLKLQPEDWLGHFVYLIYKGEEVIYVGETNNVLERLGRHIAKSPWGRLITKTEVRRFESFHAALDAEVEAIKLYKPRHNTKHNARGTPKLVLSESDGSLQAALDTYREGATISDLAVNLGVSRSTLYPIMVKYIDAETREAHRRATVARLTIELNSCDDPAMKQVLRRRRGSYVRVGINSATEIVDLYATGEYNQQQLADRFGVSQSHVSSILRRHSRAG